MPSLVSGYSAWTACAVTCPVECRRMFSPSGLSIATGSTSSSAASSRARSRNSPLTRIATTVRSAPKMSSPVVAVSTTWGSRESGRTTVMETDTTGLPFETGSCASSRARPPLCRNQPGASCVDATRPGSDPPGRNPVSYKSGEGLCEPYPPVAQPLCLRPPGEDLGGRPPLTETLRGCRFRFHSKLSPPRVTLQDLVGRRGLWSSFRCFTRRIERSLKEFAGGVMNQPVGSYGPRR